MARDLSTVDAARAAQPTEENFVTYPEGHPQMPEGGWVRQYAYAETQTEPAQQVVFIKRNGAALSRRTASMWF